MRVTSVTHSDVLASSQSLPDRATFGAAVHLALILLDAHRRSTLKSLWLCQLASSPAGRFIVIKCVTLAWPRVAVTQSDRFRYPTAHV